VVAAYQDLHIVSGFFTDLSGDLLDEFPESIDIVREIFPKFNPQAKEIPHESQ
jgi:hypothetical protein